MVHWPGHVIARRFRRVQVGIPRRVLRVVHTHDAGPPLSEPEVFGPARVLRIAARGAEQQPHRYRITRHVNLEHNESAPRRFAPPPVSVPELPSLTTHPIRACGGDGPPRTGPSVQPGQGPRGG